ncbi:hypothetical protein BH11PLA1_BH11PLA1_18100 [soil metagenome]
MSVCTSFLASITRGIPRPTPLPAALLLCAFAGAASGVPPVVYNLGVMPGGTYSFNGIVSGDGNTVTGYGDTTVASGSPVRPFRWVLPGPMQVVPLTLPSEGRGISFNGQHIVGFISAGNTPFRWTLAGGLTPLNLLPGGTTAFANGTNSNSAFSAGYGNTPVGNHAIRWNNTGAAQDLGFLSGATVISTSPGPGSYAFGISADGSAVVGTADWAPGYTRAFRWNVPFGPMLSLGTLPGGYDCRAVAISTNNSTIIGWGDTTGSVGNPRAFRLKAPMPMQNLGIIPGSGGSPNIRSLAVSGSGSRVVGTSYDNIFGNRAWIWMASTAMLDLRAHVASLGGNVTGWVFLEAHGISSDGTAVSGWGTFNGAGRAFLIKGLPCLDPTAAWFPDTAPPVGICADPNWPVGSGPDLPDAAATLTMNTEGDDPLEHKWFVTIGPPGGTAPIQITGPTFSDTQSGLTFSVAGWNSPTITISNLRPSPVQPQIWLGGTVNNPCGNAATSLRQLIVTGVCIPGQPGPCQPADMADDQGTPLPTTASNTGVNEGDYNGFFNTFFVDQSVNSPADIADDAGNPRPPFGPGGTANSGVNEGDYNCFFNNFFAGCPG